MKYHRPGTVYNSRDYAMPPQRSGLFDVLGNAVGVILILAGTALFVGAMHYLPDPSDLERRIEQRMEAMP